MSGDFSNPSEVSHIEHVFSFHPASSETGKKLDHVREEHKHLALWIERNVPPSRERDRSLAHIEESMAAACAAVSLDAAAQESRRQALHDAAGAV